MLSFKGSVAVDIGYKNYINEYNTNGVNDKIYIKLHHNILMKLPNHYPHLHRSQYKEDIETAVDGLVYRLSVTSSKLQDEEVKYVDVFTKKLATFRARLSQLHDDYNIITNDSAGRLNATSKNLYYEKDKRKLVGIIKRGIVNLKNIEESITKCKISNSKYDNVKNIDDIDNKSDREFYEIILRDNLSWGAGVVKYYNHVIFHSKE